MDARKELAEQERKIAQALSVIEGQYLWKQAKDDYGLEFPNFAAWYRERFVRRRSRRPTGR